jgi:Bacterial Ig-like domain (group 1)
MSSSFLARFSRATVALGTLSLGTALGACGADKKLGPTVPAVVSVVSGDSQTVLVGNKTSAPLVAAIKNSDGSPLPNVAVRWSVASGGGSLGTLVDTTDANGQVSTTYLSPAKVGTAKVTANAGGQLGSFTVLLVSDTVGTLSAFGGNGAAGLVSVPLNLLAAATDRFGNPIAGVPVTWSTSGGALQSATSTTDSLGRASNVITLPATAGDVTIIATSRFNAVTFTVTALAPK